jgi:hypothetical protein
MVSIEVIMKAKLIWFELPEVMVPGQLNCKMHRKLVRSGSM